MTALATYPGSPEPTAMRPDRVLVLDAGEQHVLALAMHHGRQYDEPGNQRLFNLLAYGREYADPVDELARITIEKRTLEAALRRHNARIAELKAIVVDEMAEAGVSSVKHSATGATLRITRKVWAKVCRSGEKPTDEEKAAAARGLIDAGLGDYVREDFNTNTISAHFRELIRAHDDEQRTLPEEQRRPLPASAFLPPELLGLIELSDDPDISVTASRS